MSVKNPIPARIHLLAARAAPYVIVLRRKPSEFYHIMRWNTKTDQIEHGSWFQGRIYELRCDVSFDGKYMVYFAHGNNGQTWTGVCKLPFLTTLFHRNEISTYYGGGVFDAKKRLALNDSYTDEELDRFRKMGLPFKIELLGNRADGGDEGVLYPRWFRDGYERIEVPGGPAQSKRESRRIRHGCQVRPTKNHPFLRVRDVGEDSKCVYEFDLPELPGILDGKECWVTYDALGQLVVARRGVLYRYTLKDLRNGKPTSVIDLEGLVRPVKVV